MRTLTWPARWAMFWSRLRKGTWMTVPFFPTARVSAGQRGALAEDELVLSWPATARSIEKPKKAPDWGMDSWRLELGSVETGTVNELGGAGVGRGGSAREMGSGRDGTSEGWWWTVTATMASGIERRGRRERMG